jgi:hypothetical protein
VQLACRMLSFHFRNAVRDLLSETQKPKDMKFEEYFLRIHTEK